MKTSVRFVWRIARRRPWTTTAVVAAITFVLLIVPIEPFYPRCHKRVGDPTGLVTDPLTPEYREFVKRYLSAEHVYYWEIKNRIYIRYLPYLDGMGRVVRINAIFNSSFHAIQSMTNLDPNYSHEGDIINGKPYKIPDHIRALYDVKKSRYPYNPRDCILMRAVATGQPIESTVKRN